MKDLLIVQHVWGHYTDFIPFFLLFQGLAYPEYDSLMYIYDDLSKKCIEQLEIVKNINNNFEIKKIDFKNCFLSEKALSVPQVRKSLRWLTYDESFKNYKAVYTGDIDILLFREEIPIFDAHIDHCAKMGLCYSNMERVPEKNPVNTLYSFCKDVKKYGPYWATYFLMNYAPYSYKYSGLHFVQTEPYYKAMLPVIEEYINKIEDMVRLKKGTLMIKNFSNEELLRTMIIDSGLGALSREEIYRPYHGMHIGRYRDGVFKEEKAFYEKSYGYYIQYKSIKENDLFQALINRTSDFIVQNFKYMEESYAIYEDYIFRGIEIE